MTIYDPIAIALDMAPIQFEFNENLLPGITVGESMKGSANPMFGQKRPDLVEFNKSRKGSKLSEKHRNNIAMGVKGEKNPMYGKKHTDESKKLMASNKKEVKKFFGEDNPMYGRKGELHYQYGIARSDDVKKKISEVVKNQPRIVCEHCGLPAIKSNYNRWHGVNCKLANHKT